MLALVYPLLLMACLQAGGLWCWMLLPFNILLIPLVDHLVLASAPTWEPSSGLLRHLFALKAFALYFLAQLAALILVMVEVSSRTHTALELFGLISATGIMTGTAGITAAHELIHRRSRAARSLGMGLLAMVTYAHFRVSHLAGHHRFVGTAQDPGTARSGEGYSPYLRRAMADGFTSAINLENERLKRSGKSVWTFSNKVLCYLVLEATIYVAIVATFGLTAALFFAAQSFIAVHLLEAVNYVQHYGLVRPQPGHGTRISAEIAWDSHSPVGQLLIFNLNRHAGHHLDASISCDRLKLLPGSPKLPCSFFLMVFLALFPPIWRAIMDPRVEAFHRGRLGQTSLQTSSALELQVSK
jgi:alkane 1-monooxygenase